MGRNTLLVITSPTWRLGRMYIHSKTSFYFKIAHFRIFLWNQQFGPRLRWDENGYITLLLLPFDPMTWAETPESHLIGLISNGRTSGRIEGFSKLAPFHISRKSKNLGFLPLFNVVYKVNWSQHFCSSKRNWKHHLLVLRPISYVPVWVEIRIYSSQVQHSAWAECKYTQKR